MRLLLFALLAVIPPIAKPAVITAAISGACVPPQSNTGTTASVSASLTCPVGVDYRTEHAAASGSFEHFSIEGNGITGFTGTNVTASVVANETVLITGGSGNGTLLLLYDFSFNGNGSGWNVDAHLSTPEGSGGANTTCNNGAFPFCPDFATLIHPVLSLPFTYGVPLDFSVSFIGKGMASGSFFFQGTVDLASYQAASGDTITFGAAAIPEPATYALCVLGLGLLAGRKALRAGELTHS